MNFHDLLRECEIDAEGLLERFVGNEALARKCIVMFVSEPAFDRLDEAVGAFDRESAQRAAHALKGVSGNLGMTRLFGLCSALSDGIRNKTIGNAEISEKNSEIKKEREKLSAAISRLE